MMNPQTYQRNCCHFQFKNPWKNVEPRPIHKQVKKVQIEKHNKISLKNYCSQKHIRLSELTKVSTEFPESMHKSIIQELQSIDDHMKSQLKALKEHNPFSSFCIMPQPHYRAQTKAHKQAPTLQKSKSLTKVRFSYTSIQTDTSDHQQPEYKVNIKSQKGQNLPLETKKSMLRLSTLIKQQKQEDMRSTIEPLLQIPRTGIQRPRSIISIDDDEDREDFMKESLIIERHSGRGTMERLL